MNNLSWALYIIDISQSIAVILWLSFTALFVAIIIAWIRGSYLRNGMSSRYSSLENDWKEGYLMQWNSLKLLIPIVVIAVIACLIPSRETLYMIAGSQVGEQILQLEQVQALGGEVGGLAEDTIALLREKIQDQMSHIEPVKEE